MAAYPADGSHTACRENDRSRPCSDAFYCVSKSGSRSAADAMGWICAVASSFNSFVSTCRCGAGLAHAVGCRIWNYGTQPGMDAGSLVLPLLVGMNLQYFIFGIPGFRDQLIILLFYLVTALLTAGLQHLAGSNFKMTAS